MSKAWMLLVVAGLSGCTGYSKQVVQLHLNGGNPSQGTSIVGEPSVHVTSTANAIPVEGISPNAVFELEPSPPLAAFLDARLALLVHTTGTRADCSVASVGLEVRNNLTKGTIATNLSLQCSVRGPKGISTQAYVGRDVRTLSGKWSGVDFKAELQPGLEACLQQIAPALQRDMLAAGAGL
ncbi:MAG: hypothetical protein ABWX83_03155 [Luteibacter sp.]